MTSTTQENQAVVAVYKSHDDAEQAVRELQKANIPMQHISIVGKDWQAREQVQGYYRPADAIKENAGSGAWFGGIFGLLLGFGLFILPVAGTIVVLGPLGGLLAGAIGGAGVGALVGSLVSLGIPKDEAIRYQTRVEAGEFLVVVQGSEAERAAARELLHT